MNWSDLLLFSYLTCTYKLSACLFLLRFDGYSSNISLPSELITEPGHWTQKRERAWYEDRTHYLTQTISWSTQIGQNLWYVNNIIWVNFQNLPLFKDSCDIYYSYLNHLLKMIQSILQSFKTCIAGHVSATGNNRTKKGQEEYTQVRPTPTQLWYWVQYWHVKCCSYYDKAPPKRLTVCQNHCSNFFLETSYFLKVNIVKERPCLG